MIKTIGFIGGGNMASAIIKGVVRANFMKPENIFVFDLCKEKNDTLKKECGISVAESTCEIAKKCDCVVLAVKPIAFPSLLADIKSELKENNPLIISIAAGKTTEYIGSFLDYDATIARVMPNINAKAGAAMCAYCSSKPLTEEYTEFIEGLFTSVGRIIPIGEEMFPLFSVIAGCSPAYAYMFIDALARAAVKHGMNKKTALEISAQAVLGSAKLILESGEHPWELIDQVCSPGGTTIEGLAALQDCGLDSAVRKAVDAAVEKDSKI